MTKELGEKLGEDGEIEGTRDFPGVKYGQEVR